MLSERHSLIKKYVYNMFGAKSMKVATKAGIATSASSANSTVAEPAGQKPKEAEPEADATAPSVKDMNDLIVEEAIDDFTSRFPPRLLQEKSCTTVGGRQEDESNGHVERQDHRQILDSSSEASETSSE